jgi:hypothetical protein
MTVVGLKPGLENGYVCHPLHNQNQPWAETNCYIDVWIEVLNALGLDPLACLAMVLAIDFDGDQWTFLKPSHDDIYTLYGVDVQELHIWQSLLANSSEQLRRGRLVLAEVDAFYLPDTAGTDYRRKHTKTTIAIQEINIVEQRLGYFHNGGYHTLSADDFVKTFRLDSPGDSEHMPFFAELVRCDRLVHRTPAELAELSLTTLRKHLTRVPVVNPFIAFRTNFTSELLRIRSEGTDSYHPYAFATIRQFGAAFDLAASYVTWLRQHHIACPEGTEGHFTKISEVAKILLLKGARASASSRPVDFEANLNDLEKSWDEGMALIRGNFT